MSPRGELGNPVIGEAIKVHLPGESPWADCVAINDDGTWTGRICNRLFNEFTAEERKAFSPDIGDRAHKYRQNDVVLFRREISDSYEIWVPAEKAQ
jgi:hypothetical protein